MGVRSARVGGASPASARPAPQGHPRPSTMENGLRRLVDRGTCEIFRLGRTFVRSPGKEEAMITLFYGPHACSLASHIALAEAGAPYNVAASRLPGRGRAAPAGIPRDQPERAGAGIGNRWRHSDRDARHPGLHRPELSQGGSRAPRRSLRFCAGAGLQQLSVCDGACGPCASGARHPLGGRPGGHRRDEAQGPEAVAACFDLIEQGHVRGALGHGRNL